MRTADIAASFDVSPRTIVRDIAVLRSQGVPLEGHKRKGIRLGSDFVLEPVALTRDEAALLLVGSAVVAEHIDAEARLVDRGARVRLLKAGGQGLAEDIRALERKLGLAPYSTGAVAREHKHLELLRQALVAETEVELRMSSPAGAFAFLPYGLTRVRRQWYLVGFCKRREAVCDYPVRAMREVTLQTRSFVRPKGYTAATPGDAEESVSIRFDAESSKWIVAATLDHVQAIQKKGDGILVTLAPMAAPQVLAWVLRWGAHARIVSPASLRELVATEVMKMARHYQSKAGPSQWHRTLFENCIA